MKNEFSEQVLKFADGELSTEQESCVLLECELSPELWKELALALVADRQLKSAMADFSLTDQIEAAVGSDGVERDSEERTGRGRKTWKEASLSIVGMCVAMLLAFVVGWNQADRQTPLTVEIEPSPLLVNAEDSGRATFASDATDRAAAYPQDAIVNPWTVVNKPVITKEDQAVFSDAGLNVSEENTIFLINDADGGQWAIPWKAINVTYEQ